MSRARTILLYVVLLSAGLLISCSTAKNTGTTRFYHSMTAHFNTMYNGEVAFLEGLEAQEKGHQDNYTELIPMYMVYSKKTQAMGKGNFDRAIEKSEKAIKRHSIKRKPKKPQGKLSAKKKAFFNRKEFNPYLKNAWLMLADAQFQKGEFIEAASTYNYILRLYAGQPDVASVARARLARCYVMLDWVYDAEDVLTKMKRDTITRRGAQELEATRAAYLIATQQFKEAAEPLLATAKRTKKKYERARLYYLLGQIDQLNGDNRGAYRALSKCIRLNPPYELAFNARIMQTEVLAEGQGRTMIGRLRRMAKNPNNANYLDRIYYAIGNIYLSNQDTLHTIYAWKQGIEESTQNGYAKAVVLEHLGELYWERENYIDATDCYNQLVSLMDKENERYEVTQRRSKALTEIEPHLSAVKLQDSLLVLSQLPEKEYLAAIDRVINDLKKKEKEAEKRAEAQGLNAARQNAAQAGAAAAKAGAKAGANRGQKQGTFYFYSPTTVSQGKQDFQKRWGNRPNEDNWRLSNKRSLMGDEAADTAAADSTDYGSGDFGTDTAENELSEEEQRLKDSLENDPHHREFYLKQIPFTDEQKEEANLQIRDGLYHGGVMLMEKIENFPLSRKTLDRLRAQFPDFEQMDDVYYHLFLLALREDNIDEMDEFRAILQDSFPDSKLTKTISNPRFFELAAHGKHLEDTLYQQTYEAYKQSNYAVVDAGFEESTADFPEGAHRGKFLFVHAMSRLYLGDRDSFMVEMKQVAEKYSKEEIAEMAQSIVKGVQEGRLLDSEQWDASSIWSRHAFTSDRDSASMAADTLVADPLVPYVFVLAYPTGELDEDQLLFEMARYNFTSFMARNFDIEIVPAGPITQLRVTGFLSYDEVHAYAQQLYGDTHMRQRLEGIRSILISEPNLKLLGVRYSYDEYAEFYEEELSPMEVPEELILDAPTEDYPTDIDDVPEGQENQQNAENGENTEASEEEDDATEDDDDWMP